MNVNLASAVAELAIPMLQEQRDEYLQRARAAEGEVSRLKAIAQTALDKVCGESDGIIDNCAAIYEAALEQIAA